MRKVLFIIALVLLPMLASAEAVEIDGIYYNLDSESKTAAVTKNPDNYQGDVTIPESFEYSGTTYSVTSIGDYAFYQCSGLTSVSMPDGVTSIGRSAFEKCSGLTSVNIPNSVTTIGRYAFWECSSLSAITIPNSVGTIGYRTFSDCNGLISVIIENGVTTIDDYAFWGCSSLTTITIPSSVTSIGMASFGQCIRLATVTIGSSTSSIGYHAFEDCTSLTSIIVDETNQTFKSVDGVLISKNGTTILTYPAGKTETAYIIPSGVTSIGESAFYGCGGLTSVIIPDGVTSIGIGAFSGCSGLASVIIPGGVTTIGGGAFADCSSLTSITVDGSNPNYKSEDGVLLSKDGTTLITYPIGKTETAYIISDGVTTIDYSAFRGCSGLISVTIPSSMTSIGYHAFYGCSGLTSVTIPGSVTAIGDWTFAFCNSLTSITIGSGVTAIGGWAFYGCTDLSNVFCYAKDVPTTDNRAFSNSNVANATLHVPEGAVEAYKAAEPWNQFKEIVALSGEEFDPDGNGLIDDVEIDGIYYDLVIDSKEAIVKSNPNKYQGNVTIPETVKYGGITYNLTSIGRSAFVGCSDLTAIIIPNSVTAIDDYAFSACSGLTSVSIPNSVTAIGEGAFWGCSGLTTITIPDGVGTIDVGVFCYCSGLTAIIVDEANTSYKSVDGVLMSKDGTTLLAYPAGKPETAYAIPDGVTTIGDDAFASCSGLTAITIGSGVTAIGKQAFCNCSGLTSIIIPSGVTSIEDEVFYGCSGLTSVTIPASVTSIGDDAFRMCSSLTDMFCRAKNVPTTGKNVFQRSNIANATLHVPGEAIEAYKAVEPWNQFKEIVALEKETIEGDTNGDGVVDANDVVALVNLIAAGDVSAVGDLNGDGKIDIADIIALVNIITGK